MFWKIVAWVLAGLLFAAIGLLYWIVRSMSDGYGEAFGYPRRRFQNRR